MKKNAIFFFCVFAGTAFVLTAGCHTTVKTGRVLQNEQLNEGEYIGEYSGGPNKATVRITIKNLRITKIEIVRHDAWKGKKAEAEIIRRIIKEQSTDVDAVTGATNSSHVIMNAVQNAVEQAVPPK